MTSALLTGIVLAIWAVLFAMLEISIEGQVGWALTAPTWRKKSAIYGAFMSGKELTGYHLVMFFLPYLFLHLPFVLGAYWGVNMFSVWRELEIVAAFFLLSVHWDWWWFVLNPYFGLKRFRRGEIWWHAKWVGRIPADYIGGGVVVVLFTAAAWYGDHDALLRMGIIVAVFAASSFLVIAFASRYHRWCERMQESHKLVWQDWVGYLNPEEMDELRQRLELINEGRRKVAELGRRRAQCEQLGIKK